MDGGEEIHAPLGLLTLDALHTLEGVEEGVGALPEAGLDAFVFGAVELVGRVARGRGVALHLDEALADDGRAEHDADEFVDLGGDVGGEAGELEVAAAVAAFAHHALGDAVEGGEFEVVEFFLLGGRRRGGGG